MEDEPLHCQQGQVLLGHSCSCGHRAVLILVPSPSCSPRADQLRGASVQGTWGRCQASQRPLALRRLPFLLRGVPGLTHPPGPSDGTHGLARGRYEDRARRTRYKEQAHTKRSHWALHSQGQSVQDAPKVTCRNTDTQGGLWGSDHILRALMVNGILKKGHRAVPGGAHP